MKMLKKTLCVFLSVLMLISGLSIGMVAFAQDLRSDISYRALAYSFFNYEVVSSGFSSTFVVKTDENGYPDTSIVSDMDHYVLTNESGEYAYADEEGNPIRAISYDHLVTAKDDSTYRIRNAALEYLGIVDSIISLEYGVGLYTVPMVAEEVATALMFTKGDDGEYLFLDGYTYVEDAVGEIVDRSPMKTYDVVDGEIVDLEVDETWMDEYAEGYNFITLYEYCNVATIIDYFSGNFTSVNSGNWFHNYVFYCYTDLETVLTTEALVNLPVTKRYLTVEWNMNRQYDESGTEAQYYNAGYTADTTKSEIDYTRQELVTLQGAMDNYFVTYYGNDYRGRPLLPNATNGQLLSTYYDDITTYYDTFASLSNKAKLAVFGQSAYSYINLVTQLTPIVNTGAPYDATYWPKHTYTKYQDDQGNDVVYQVDANKVTSIVSTIDGLLKSERVGAILKQFFDYTGPEYEDKAYYYDAQNAKTAQDILKVVVADFVYNDDIINMLLGMLYPMVTNLLDDLITDEMINGAISGLWSGLVPIVEWIVENDEGWLGLIYGVLTDIGVGLTPAGVAYVWNKYGYNNNDYFKSMTRNHDILKAARGGTRDRSGNGWYETAGYYSIGVQGDTYHLDRWKDVDTDLIVWDINGDRERFQNALCAILAPLAPLLGVILGNQKSELKVGQLAFDIILVLEDMALYNDVLLPLLEALGIPGLASAATFESLAGVINSDSSRTKETIENFLNQGLLTPILNWVENVVLGDPIGTILNLLPNVSYYLTSGAVLSSVNSVTIPIGLKFGIDYGSVYDLVLGDLLGDDTLAFLDSLQGILDLIGFSVDTGIPVVGYHAEGDNMVYKPGDAGYNEETMTIPVTEAFRSSSGFMNIYQNSEFTTKVTGLNEDGTYTQYAVFNDVGWMSAAGNVVTEHNSIDATTDMYPTAVKQYYEYTVTNVVGTDPETGEELTEDIVFRVAYANMIPADKFIANEFTLVQDVVTLEEPASLPPIMDYKLQAVGTLSTTTSGRYTSFTMTNKDGVQETWAAYSRKYIDVQVGGMETEGLVLLFLFRYIFSALMYRSYDVNAQDFTSDYTLLDAFGLGGETLTDELFAGLRLQDIIDNIALHPDEAIAALFELFYKNEYGSIYEVVNGIVQANQIGFTYDIEYVDYHTEDILGYAEEFDDYSYGTSVLYTEHWTKEKASYIVDNLDDIVDNVFKMLKLEGMETIGQYLEGLIGDMLFTNDMLSTIASALYGLFADLGGDIDIGGILDAALDVDMTKQALANALLYEFGSAVTKNGSFVDEEGNTVAVSSVYNQLMVENRQTAAYETEANTARANGDYELYREKLAIAAESAKYTDATFYKVGVVENDVLDEETGEPTGEKVEETVNLYALDWGYNNPEITAQYTDTEIFLRAVSAIASPFAFLIKFIFAGEDLSVLNLINIPGYEVYYYAWIPFMETLGATDGLLDFEQYFGKMFAGESVTAMNCDTIYYLIKPLFAFVERVLANPIEIVLNIIPNLLFFISIGGLNGVINNIAHFAYVLLDILTPIVDAYPVVNSLLSNIRIGDVALNLALPLDFDFNQLINQLLEGVLGENLSFEIENENLVIGTQEVEKEVFEPTLDADGNEQYDEDGNVIGAMVTKTVTEDVYAVGELNITLPYIDFSTLCAGTVQERMSVSGRRYIYLNAAGGADLITLVFRIVADTLFFEDNAVNIANFLIGFCQLDDEADNDDLLMEIFLYLNDKALEAEMPDQLLNLIYTIYTVLVPIADELGSRFANVDFSITDLFDSIDDSELLQERISALLGASDDPNPTLSGFARLIELIKQFFAKIGEFFAALFGG